MTRANRVLAFQKPGTTRTLSQDGEGAVIRRTVLPGGLRVVTEAMPGARSAAVGIWVGVGSRDESPRLAGASHYLEHLLFKGTATRSAMEIAAAVDAVGGELNAFTAKEHTCYYAHVLAEDLPLAVDLVSDVVLHATIAAADVDSERNVILEEIAMRDDDPTDGVHDLFSEGLFGDHPLGRPVLGTVASIEALSRGQVAGYYRRRYQLPTMVVSVAGRLEHRTVVRLVRRAFGSLLDSDRLPAPARSARRPAARPARPVVTLNRPTEQANLVLGTVGLARDDDRRFALSVLNNALGGGMSSRLFQEIREKRGLAYSVYSYSSQYADAGQFGVYVGCQPARAHAVLDLIREQFGDVAEHGLTDQEIARGKGQVRGGLVLGLEDPGSRMSRIGKGEIAYGDVLEVDELLGRVDAVTPEDVRAVAADLLRGPMCLAVVGPFDDSDFDTVR
ncbi:MAG TPA: pitrilysin family protein [Mycobacteriales bacterium]|nr:pitrilysin family protein [Mycobacteriales bacterium]